MPYMADAAVDMSGTVCLIVHPHTHGNPDEYMTVRLSNGAVYYTATGNGGGLSGSEFIADQGSPAILSSAWPVKLTDGAVILGLSGAPLFVSGSAGLLVGGSPTSISNPVPAATQEPLVQWQYDLGLTDPSTYYAGYATRGASTGSAEWTIKRSTFDVSGNLQSVQWTTGSVWTSRTSEVYT